MRPNKVETAVHCPVCRMEVLAGFSSHSNSITIYIYIYIYIVIHRQTVSLYHNSSLQLDTQDASSWDRNQPNFTQDILSNISTISATYVSSGIIKHMY